MYDVIVVGGGPSGLNSAKTLAEKGLDVLVLERKNGIGTSVVCTGIVGNEAFNNFNLNTDSILTDIQNFKMVSPFQTSVVYSHSQPFAYVVDRERFDNNLARETEAKGALIKTGHQVTDVSVARDSVKVVTKSLQNGSMSLAAKVVILATGIDNRISRKLGLGYSKDYLNGIQAEIEWGHSGCPEIFFGKDIAPGAFAWIVPLNKKKARVGLLSKKDPQDYFCKFIQSLHPKSNNHLKKGCIQVKPIAQGLLSKTYGNRVLVVGEAAGQVKTTTGGGIFFGLLCSDIAAQVIHKKIHENRLLSHDLSEYEKLWKRAIQKEILIGYYTRKLCEKLSDFQIENMFQIARSDGVLPLIRKKGNFDWQSEIILALAKRAPLRSLQSICSAGSLGHISRIS